MAYDESLKNVSTHFEFGENWANFSKSISEEKIREAELGLQNLITGTDLSDRSFLDIGCGSGIHSLAALNLGAKSVTAIDIDPASVETSKNVLATYSSTDQFRTMVGNVFAPPFDDEEKFDVVYSWGVGRTARNPCVRRRSAAVARRRAPPRRLRPWSGRD